MLPFPYAVEYGGGGVRLAESGSLSLWVNVTFGGGGDWLALASKTWRGGGEDGAAFVSKTWPVDNLTSIRHDKSRGASSASLDCILMLVLRRGV